MGFLVAAWVGPTLVAPDLANGALPLYFSRPFSRAEYVVGRLATLFFLLSAITWVPDLLLWLLQGSLAGNGWMGDNLHLARAIVLNALVWILVVSLLALAISAWVKWRMVASGLLFGVFFVAAGFGQAINLILRTYWGSLLDISYLMKTVWTDLFDLPEVAARPRRWGAEVQDDIPAGIAWIALATLCTICIAILNRRLRAREVVRG
jgi:ABC-2 type transport system permease protein